MERGRGGRDDFFGFGGFGDPFAGFGGFGDPLAGFGGFGRPGSLISNVFGGRDPFDDPFFTRPSGSMMGPNMFGPRLFGAGGNLFGETSNAGFLEQQAPPPNQSKGPIIKELTSDDEDEEGEKTVEEKDNPRKHSRSNKEPYIQDPDEEVEGKKIKHMQYWNDFNRANTVKPQSHTYSFHSSTMTYGGPNGAYYTSSTTRRAGGDGVMVEESKEADTTTGKATHSVSRGIHDKGHSITRKLNSDGRVDSMQTLHNLNEDELHVFDEAWKGNARQYLPGWNQGIDLLDSGNIRNNRRGNRHNGQPPRGWALPSTEQPRTSASTRMQSQRSSFGGTTQ